MRPLSDAQLDDLRRWLLRQARAMQGDADLAEDSVQECLEALIRHGDTIRDLRALHGWCLTVLRNLLRQRLRRPVLQRVEAAAEPPDTGHDPWHSVDGELATEALLSLLREPQRATAREFYLGGATIRQIAADAGRPEGTIKRWLHESREAMRMALQPEEKPRPRAYVYGTNWLDDARTALDRALQEAGHRPVWGALGEGELPGDAALFVFGERVGERSGLELLLNVRAKPELAQTPVLLFGPARQTAMLAAWQAGADAYLTDPSSPDVAALLEKLRAGPR